MPIPTFLQPLQPLSGVAPSPSPAVAPSLGGAATSGSLNGFAVEHQQEDNWCWAAVSTSVATFFGSTAWSQCKVASDELTLSCCGTPDASTGCNVAWYLDRALTRVGHFDYLSAASEPFATVQGEIAAGRPLGCRIAWAVGSAHFVALGGWLTAPDGTQYVDVHDPWYGFTQLPYNTFVSSYRTPGDSWTHSYFVAAAAAVAAAGAPVVNAPKSA
jgi:hypothetical protein